MILVTDLRLKLAESVERTHRWETRSLARHLEEPAKQAMYAVIHGGVDLELRRHSVESLGSLVTCNL